MQENDRGFSDGNIPPVIFGTSGLGNLFKAATEAEKLEIVEQCMRLSAKPVVFDTAGKYGAGLALESLGNCLRQLHADPQEVFISNKLGWLRSELVGQEPTFEQGVWKNLKHDAVQKISYQGILECYEQGNELLSGYSPQWLSVHDPDEYISRAVSEQHAQELYNDVLDAYRALAELKSAGNVKAIGVGAKDWRIIKKLSADVQLDWVMIANSLTIKQHPPELLSFINDLRKNGIMIINSAVFHSGFLIGGDHYDYKPVSRDLPVNKGLFEWRDGFFRLCDAYQVRPAHACIQFALNIPGISAIALNTTAPKRVKENLEMAHERIPGALWKEMKSEGLISPEYPYL